MRQYEDFAGITEFLSEVKTWWKRKAEPVTTGIKTITSERYACEYCGEDGSRSRIIRAVPLLTENVEGKWDKQDVSDHILKYHPEKILERLAALEQALLDRKQHYENMLRLEHDKAILARESLRSLGLR